MKVDDAYRTDEPNIYAVGDAIGGLLLAHVAGAEGQIAAEAMAGKETDEAGLQRECRGSRTRIRRSRRSA